MRGPFQRLMMAERGKKAGQSEHDSDGPTKLIRHFRTKRINFCVDLSIEMRERRRISRLPAGPLEYTIEDFNREAATRRPE